MHGFDPVLRYDQVIDGQQRLTSLFIMLACLHNWAKQQVGVGQVWKGKVAELREG